MSDVTILVFFGVILLAIAALLIPRIATAFSEPDAAKMLHDFMASAKARGLSHVEARAELAMREAFVRIHRELSAAVVGKGASAYDETLDRMMRDEGKKITAAFGIQNASTFRRWIGGLSYVHLLDAKACGEMSKWIKSHRADVHADTIEALKIGR